MKFHPNSFNGFQLKDKTRNCISNVPNDQSEITLKIQVRVMVLVHDVVSLCFTNV